MGVDLFDGVPGAKTMESLGDLIPKIGATSFGKGIVVDEANDSYGKFVAEPFERGFGITIGNSPQSAVVLYG